MSRLGSTDELSALIDEIVAGLAGEGFTEHARRLHELLHEMAWTTSSELFGELGLALSAVKRETRGRLSRDLQKAIARGLRAVRGTWPWLR